MILLELREYAKVVSEINTNYAKYQGKRVAIHLSYVIDNRAYAYVFQNLGFDNYVFIARDLIE